ncbi:MAG: hypothetical protein MZW92_32970 [Comamonadaceae bacterium]|nr:hypothetical protein [Comamonadaceae bacterium]
MIDSGGVEGLPEATSRRSPRAIRRCAEVAVFGVPHAKWGETPVAAVVLQAGAQRRRRRTARLDQRARRRALPARLRA